MDFKELQKTLEYEERELQFLEFTNETALTIGMNLVNQAKQKGLKITVDITKSGQQIFHYSCDGTSPDNDQWILRKNRVVNRFHMSSYHVGINLKESGKTMEEKYSINSSDYAAHGGAFPICIKNVGVIGTITVSGLAQEDDHSMVVSAIREYLNR